MKVLQIILLIVFSVGATVSYAEPPASKGKTFSSKIQKTVRQKSSNSVLLSIAKFLPIPEAHEYEAYCGSSIFEATRL